MKRRCGRKRIYDKPRSMLFAMVTADERSRLLGVMAAEGVSISNFLRRCINHFLEDGYPDVDLLMETTKDEVAT